MTRWPMSLDQRRHISDGVRAAYLERVADEFTGSTLPVIPPPRPIPEGETECLCSHAIERGHGPDGCLSRLCGCRRARTANLEAAL